MTWSIRYKRQAEKTLDALDPVIRRRIVIAIGNLANNPHTAANIKPLQGQQNFRLRVGDWRVIYTLENEILTILIIRIAHRGDAYR